VIWKRCVTISRHCGFFFVVTKSRESCLFWPNPRLTETAAPFAPSTLTTPPLSSSPHVRVVCAAHTEWWAPWLLVHGMVLGSSYCCLPPLMLRQTNPYPSQISIFFFLPRALGCPPIPIAPTLTLPPVSSFSLSLLFPIVKNWQSLSKFLFEHNDVFQIGKPRKDPQDPNISQFSISKVDSQVRFVLYGVDDRWSTRSSYSRRFALVAMPSHLVQWIKSQLRNVSCRPLV